MAPRKLSDFLRALLAVVGREITEWKHAIGWGRFLVAVAFAASK
jgi:hypothetical protein